MDFEITTGRDAGRPLTVTICGEQGIGKTCLAAAFPRPVILRTEDGTMSIPKGRAMQSPMLRKMTDVYDAIKQAAAIEKAGTVVIDSISTLDAIVEQEIVASDGKAQSLNQAMGGYGAGARALSAKMRRLRNFCEHVTNAGKHLVFIAHSHVDTVKPVDTDPYNVLTLRMNKGSIPPFTDLVDCVAFLRLDVDTERAGKDSIALSSGDRVLQCHPSAAIAAKNRLGITETLDCPEGANPILEFLKAKQE